MWIAAALLAGYVLLQAFKNEKVSPTPVPGPEPHSHPHPHI